MFFAKRIICFLLLALIFQNAHGRWRGNDLVELKAGFWVSGEEDYKVRLTEESPGGFVWTNLIFDFSYGRYLKKDLLLDFNIGMAGMEEATDSDDNVFLRLIPIGLSINKILGVIRSVEYKVGAGLDYMLVRGEVNDDESYSKDFGGYHLKFGVRHFMFTSELKYSVIDRYGKNDHNFGGWSLTVGLAFQFFLF